MVDIEMGQLERLKLLPCPFCGTDASLTYTRAQKERKGAWFVRCHRYRCTLSMGGLFYGTAEDAIENWNTRDGKLALKQEYDT